MTPTQSLTSEKQRAYNKSWVSKNHARIQAGKAKHREWIAAARIERDNLSDEPSRNARRRKRERYATDTVYADKCRQVSLDKARVRAERSAARRGNRATVRSHTNVRLHAVLSVEVPALDASGKIRFWKKSNAVTTGTL